MKLKNPSLKKEKLRLEALIDIMETGSEDFQQSLFFAQQKTNNRYAAYRKTLDEYIKNNN